MGVRQSSIAKKQLKAVAAIGPEIWTSTRFTRDELVNLHRAFLTDCPSGKLSLVQFESVYADFFPSASSSALFATHLFRSFDFNNDGTLDFVEFAQALSIMQRGSDEDKLDWIFRLYDVDGNGVITQEDVSEIVKSLNLLSRPKDKLNLSPSPPRLGFKGDEDCDDFCASHAVKLFSELDTDGDGFVTKEEFVAVARTDPQLIKHLSS